ncbi:MAG: HNH endonuclease [Kangiella sp.]|nr:MAG: HNH endonuclease [Kangiella sp.]
MLTEKLQIEFIQYLSRLFREGDFSATYKYAFLNALADLCVENKLENNIVISVRALTEKMVELYWEQSRPFSDQNHYLLQNSGRQSAIINRIIEKQSQGYRLGQFKLNANEFGRFISGLIPTIKNGPLWRLQILSEHLIKFLYTPADGHNSIRLNDGIQKCFQIYYDLIISLTRDRWQQKIRSIPSNFDLLGKQGDLENFLFGTKRKSLKKVEELLQELQKGICFYCEKIMRDKVAVDHFIPWSRYPNDLGHNFVLAHDKCNSSKKDYLANSSYLRKWDEYNLNLFRVDIEDSLASYFLCDADRSLAISDWAYANNTAPLWNL